MQYLPHATSYHTIKCVTADTGLPINMFLYRNSLCNKQKVLGFILFRTINVLWLWFQDMGLNGFSFFGKGGRVAGVSPNIQTIITNTVRACVKCYPKSGHVPYSPSLDGRLTSALRLHACGVRSCAVRHPSVRGFKGSTTLLSIKTLSDSPSPKC